MIEYRCSCGKGFNLTDDLAGKKVECCFCDAVGTVKGKEPQAASAPVRVTVPSSGGTLSSFSELFGSAWEIYKQKWLPAFLFALLSIVICVLPIGLVAGLTGILGSMMKGIRTPVIIVGGLSAALLGLYLISWTTAAYFRLIIVPESGVMESLRRSRMIAWGFLGFMSLWGFLALGGFFLLVIPGILFIVWFCFAPFIYLQDEADSMESLMRSREYVRGYWWPVALRLLGVWILYLLISAIPFVGQLLSLIFVAFLYAYAFVLYEDLKRIKGASLPEASRKAKTGVVLTGLAGFIALPLTLILLGGAALMGLLFKAMTMINWKNMKTPAIMQMRRNTVSGSMQQGSGMQDMKPTPTLYVYALNYKGKVLFNGEKFYEFEGEPDMSCNMNGGGGDFKEGINVVEVEYEPKPSSHDFMKPEIKIEVYAFDWKTNQKNTLQEWAVNDPNPGSKHFEFEWKP